MIWAVTLLLLSAAMALPTLWPRLFPSHYVSDLYRRYEHNPHIHTTEIHNFHVNDTLSVDALLFQADTDSAWYTLLADFGSPEEIIELYKSDKEAFVGKGHHTIIFFFIDKNNPQKRLPRNDPDSRLVIGSHEKKSLLLFLAEDKTIKDAIGLGEVHKLNKKNKQTSQSHR